MKRRDRRLLRAMEKINQLFMSEKDQKTWTIDDLLQGSKLRKSVLSEAINEMLHRKQLHKHRDYYIVSGGHRKTLNQPRSPAEVIKR